MITSRSTRSVSRLPLKIRNFHSSHLDDSVPDSKQVTDQFLRLQKKDRRR